ncbi:MAG: M23 family metallopeptidase [Candidatus Saccharibacteria bacterium]|nr:M23 family metallopeptidase [Rhodoferax sp.]
MTSTPFYRRPWLVATVAVIAFAALGYGAFLTWKRLMPPTAGPVLLTAQPQKIWIEAGDVMQTLNFDILVDNQGKAPLGIDSIELTAYDSQGKPILRRMIDSNGFAPSIDTVPGRVIAPGAKVLVFNPFHSFRADIDLHRLSYTFNLSIPQESPETSASLTVEPQVYQGKTALSLPAKGKVLIHDGHDFYAHHRRLNTEHVAAKDLGLTQNFMRYSLDINPTNERFEPYRDKGARNEDWFAWGQPLVAPGDGTVVDAADVTPDNIRGGTNYFNGADVKTAPMQFYGNYLLIDHGNGEFSLLGHVQKGSLQVKVGDKVQRGQLVAKIGSSGSSNNPHVHYELRTGTGLHVEGLPAMFQNYTRHWGSKSAVVASGPVDTGDMLESR